MCHLQQHLMPSLEVVTNYQLFEVGQFWQIHRKKQHFFAVAIIVHVQYHSNFHATAEVAEPLSLPSFILP